MKIIGKFGQPCSMVNYFKAFLVKAPKVNGNWANRPFENDPKPITDLSKRPLNWASVPVRIIGP